MLEQALEEAEEYCEKLHTCSKQLLKSRGQEERLLLENEQLNCEVSRLHTENEDLRHDVKVTLLNQT